MVNAEQLNNNLQKAIKDRLPKDINIATFLTNTLFIGKEAVYRRLRGEVPFSLSEAANIARQLGISIDSLILTTSSSNPIYELIDQQYYDLRESDYRAMEEFRDVLKVASEERYSEQVYTSNLFPVFPANRYYLFGKYNSFRWMYLNQDLSSIKVFSEIEYPERLHTISKEIIEQVGNIKNTVYIWDSTIIQSIVKEISYFRSIRLMNDDDVCNFKEELHNFLNLLEDTASKGKLANGNKIQIYISNINTDTSYSYLETPNLHLSMIGAFAMNYVVSLDSKSLDRMKNRILSLKRVSTLISESGEIQRIQFFKNQHDIVDSL